MTLKSSPDGTQHSELMSHREYGVAHGACCISYVCLTQCNLVMVYNTGLLPQICIALEAVLHNLHEDACEACSRVGSPSRCNLDIVGNEYWYVT